MLFLMMFIVLLMSLTIWLLGSKVLHSEALDIIGSLGVVLSIIAAIVMVLIISLNHIGSDAKVEKYKETQKALIYKVESESCRDELGLLNKEIIDEIQAWNEDVAYRKRVQEDLWLGIFYPNIYDQFEIIEYDLK